MSTEDTAEEEGNWKHTGSNPPTCKSKYQLLQDAFIGPTLLPEEEEKKKKTRFSWVELHLQHSWTHKCLSHTSNRGKKHKCNCSPEDYPDLIQQDTEAYL